MTADRSTRWSGPAPTMRDVSHLHPDHDPRGWHWFTRGPLIAADGGRPEDDDERDVEEESLRDVSHEAADDPGANRVWGRGEDDEEPE